MINTNMHSKDISLTPDRMTGVILAGGKSTRYGTNKALAEMKGIRLIDRAVRILASVFPRLILVTNTPQDYAYLQIPMFEDLIKGLGPIGGIYTGLNSMSDPAGFFVACDMPFINPDLVRHMVRIANDYDAVVPKVGWKIEPLHALYHKSCLPFIRTAIEAEEYQIFKCYDRIHVRYVEEEEIRGYDPQLKAFFNVNKPEELLNAEKMGDL